MKTTSSKRKITRFLVRPQTQFKHAMFAVGYSMVTILCIQGISTYRLSTVASQLTLGEQDKNFIINFLSESFWINFGVLILMAIVSFLISIVISHRFSGPVIPLLRHINKLAENDFNYRTQLRSNDDLREIAEALNLLSKTWSEKQKRDTQNV